MIGYLLFSVYCITCSLLVAGILKTKTEQLVERVNWKDEEVISVFKKITERSSENKLDFEKMASEIRKRYNV